MKIKKRNGKVVEFDKSKISNAVIKAFTEVTGGHHRQLPDRAGSEEAA